LCDGDDYWIDENKLQDQVRFLDNNSDFSLVHSDVLGNQDGTIIDPIPLKNGIIKMISCHSKNHYTYQLHLQVHLCLET